MTWVMSSTSMPRATMSVATSTRIFPFANPPRAFCRAPCVLFEWMAATLISSFFKWRTTVSARRFVLAKIKTRLVPFVVFKRWASSFRLSSRVTMNTLWSILRGTVVRCATSTRTGF